MPDSGERWKQFTLGERVGAGGMGEVFVAEDTSLNRKVALKFLPESLQRNDSARERFLREARSAASLDHPYVCKIFEIGEVDDEIFIAMEYVDGETLQDKLARGSIPLSDLVPVGIEICEAVEAAHKKQVVHRDLKAANIMVTTDGHVKVMDFGLAKQVATEDAHGSQVDTKSAKLTEHGSTPGTVVYMSPEQVRGEQLDTRSDIFSVGVLLYELATGQVPFEGATSGLTYDAILNRGAKPPRQVNPEVPVELEQIVKKALEKDREVRYQTIREMLVDLKRLRRDSDSGTLSFSQPEVNLSADPSESSNASASSRRFAFALVAVLVAVVLFLALRTRLGGLAGDAPAIDSLAVLPFDNTRDDPGVDYLSDGIAESLINQLSQLPQLSVMARSTAFRYRGSEVDPQQVGEELGVGAVLTGRVVQQGDRLNVQAELVETERGTQLWGQQYERELDDLISVQNEIAAEISQALRLQLSGDEQRQIAASGTADSAAYQSYLRGRFLWSKRTNEDFKRAIAHFEEARQKDPSYALAYAGLADSYFLLGAGFYGADADFPPADAVAQARAAALEALRLDDSLAEPRATLGFIRFARDWDWDGAEEDFRAAIEHDPDYGTAHQWYALYLLAVGRLEEAIEECRHAIDLEPLSPLANRVLGSAYAQAGRYDDAVAQFQRTLEVAPAFPLTRRWLANSYWIRGDTDDAIATIEALDPEVARVYRLVAEGKMDEARSALRELPAPEREGRNAARFLLVDDWEPVVALLDGWVETRDPQLAVLFVDPLLAPHRSDPRLLEVRERVGLPR